VVTDSNDKLEILKSRIVKGNDYCNDQWQKIKAIPDNDEQGINKAVDQLNIHHERLMGLVILLNYEGYEDCIFGQCKMDDEKYFCFGCTKK
jgi:hypothetical protein